MKEEPRLNIQVGSAEGYDNFISFGDAIRTSCEKRHLNLSDASYEVLSNQVTAYSKEILHTLYFSLVSPDLMVTKNIGKGMVKWTFDNWTEPRAPEQDKYFKGWNEKGTRKQETTIELMGISYDYAIDMVTRDAESNPNSIISFPETLMKGTFVELFNSLMQYRERIIFRGADIPTTYGWTNTGQTGLVNDASLTAPSAFATALTTSGGMHAACLELANDLIDRKFRGPFPVHMTSGAWMQANVNKNATSGITDLQFILEDGNLLPPVMNMYLLNSFTETNSTAALGLFAPTVRPTKGMIAQEAQNFQIIESYSPAAYPMPPQYLEVPTKILWMGITELRRPDAVAFAENQTINTK